MLQKTTADALTHSLKEVLSIVVLASVVVAMDWKLALAAAFVFPLVAYPAMRFGRKIKSASRKGQVSMGSLTSLIYEAISGVRIVKAFNMEDYEGEKFERENKNFTRHMIRTVKIKGLSVPLMETVGAVSFAVTILYASYRIGAGTLTPEAFISFFTATIMLYAPVKALNSVNLNIQQGLAAATRVFEALDAEIEPDGPGGENELKGFFHSIEFRNVSFGYSGEKVLNDINLVVKKGEKIAIVGASGVGKTTFVNLIPRFYDATAGAILMDGTDIREFTLASLRAQIAIVGQDIVLFNDTVSGNIGYGDPGKDMEEIKKAARAANASQFIERLSRGYLTPIGERGVKLSGGQRQRVSIARAILKDAPILILDEATSSLDSAAEKEVEKALANLMSGKTTFVIAHRLSTVRNADRIMVLSNGKITEIGRHGELLEKGGEYARLYSMQFQEAGR
jgi:subfamily B ATP-binding cassette protein MsbA